MQVGFWLFVQEFKQNFLAQVLELQVVGRVPKSFSSSRKPCIGSSATLFSALLVPSPIIISQCCELELNCSLESFSLCCPTNFNGGWSARKHDCLSKSAKSL